MKTSWPKPRWIGQCTMLISNSEPVMTKRMSVDMRKYQYDFFSEDSVSEVDHGHSDEDREAQCMVRKDHVMRNQDDDSMDDILGVGRAKHRQPHEDSEEEESVESNDCQAMGLLAQAIRHMLVNQIADLQRKPLSRKKKKRGVVVIDNPELMPTEQRSRKREDTRRKTAVRLRISVEQSEPLPRSLRQNGRQQKNSNFHQNL